MKPGAPAGQSARHEPKADCVLPAGHAEKQVVALLPTVPTGQSLTHWAPLNVDPAAHERQLLPLGVPIGHAANWLCTRATRTPPSLFGSEHRPDGADALTVHVTGHCPHAGPSILYSVGRAVEVAATVVRAVDGCAVVARAVDGWVELVRALDG